MTAYARSSAGRAAVSKTVGRGFEAFFPCQTPDNLSGVFYVFLDLYLDLNYDAFVDLMCELSAFGAASAGVGSTFSFVRLVVL